MKIKETLKLFCPPIFIRALSLLRKNSIQFTGQYSSWQEAKNNASGYDDSLILQRVREASLRVKNGEAVFERDSVCFYTQEYRWPILACLMSIAALEKDRKLNVLDFGGALGSFYHQHKKFLSELTSVRWSIIEQSHFVQCGKQEFQNDYLNFYEHIDECLEYEKVNVVFLSSVLQYLEYPYDVIQNLVEVDADYIIIDNTIVNNSLQNKIYVQKTPKQLYSASYPCWSLSEDELINSLTKNYQLVSAFQGLEFNALTKIDSQFKGFLFRKNTVK